MAPKRVRQQNKTVTIYNSKAIQSGSSGKKDKHGSGSNNMFEQSRNNMENWEFHFKLNELEEVASILKCKDLGGVPLIIGAVVLNHKEILSNLIKHGYNVNEGDKNNTTPLCWAVKLKLLEMIYLLLNNKADHSMKPNNGDDAIFMALTSSVWDEESFTLFWNYLKNVGHIDVNATNRNGLTMLHLAVRREWNVFVDILISNEVNINASNPNGVTPLMLACYRNDCGTVIRLISKGASVKRRNSDGFTALCYAFSSAIMKKLSPPFTVVEKLQAELAKNKVHLSDYLKDRIRIILNPVKKVNTDQPSAEQMLQHIITFIVCHTDGGFDALWNELEIAHVIKESLEKHADDKEHIRLPLIVLNTLVKTLPHRSGSLNSEDVIYEAFVKTGTFDFCVELLKKYSSENVLTYLSYAPIVLSSWNDATKIWLENRKELLLKYHDRFLEALTTVELSHNDFILVKEKTDQMIVRINKGAAPEPIASPAADKPSESKSSNKKTKRRSKALKAKIAKIKTAELAERVNVRKAIEKKWSVPQEVPPEPYLDPEDNICVNAIKTAIGILEEDKAEADPSSKGKSGNVFMKEDWKTTIQQLPFHPMARSMGGFNEAHDQKCTFLDVDLAIKYLESLLGLIVNKYKIMWELDKPFEQDSGNDFDIIIPIIETNMELQQNVEKEKLRVIHREFYNLTRNIRQAYDVDPDACQQLLKDLEKLLLTHSIRGETILEQVAAMELVKVNVTMPVDFENQLPEYMEQVLNKEIEEIDDVNIRVVEHLSAEKNADHGMGDYVYLNEISSLMNKRCDCSSSVASSKSDYYHLASSILNICDESDDVGKSCCSKGCVKGSESVEAKAKDSRWSSLLRSLEMMPDCQCFFNSKIRISNIEKRKLHILYPSGNFAALEIGLGRDNIPLAVKFVPKNDAYATLLKSQIDSVIDLRHKNILNYHLCAYNVNCLVIATPLCEYNLGQYVLKMKHTQIKTCKVSIIKQILAGLMFLHDHDEPIVHGNLKPSNVLVDVDGNVKIAEFGIHKSLLKVKNLPESTIIWFATESYKLYKQNCCLECTCASDIQVAGMLMHFAMNNGCHPFGKDVPDILKNLEKATPQIISKDMELYDLLTWMLLGEPSERPTIHQVLSHIFFWSNKKKWRYILACAGIGPKSSIAMDTVKLHTSLDKTAAKENIMGNCWVLTAKKQYPQATFIDNNDTPSGLLKFIKLVVENNLILQDDSEKSISSFILNAFPYFSLSLYRMIENTEWSDHCAFMPFHNVVDY